MSDTTAKLTEIEKSIGYCGLICKLCHLAHTCSGCKSDENCCAKHLSSEGCYQYNCCTQKGLNGCWECEDFCCGKDMFSDSHDIKIRAFVRCAKEEGTNKLVEYVIRNQHKGINHGFQKDYDGLENEKAVLKLLRNGNL